MQKPLGSHAMVALIPARAGSKRCPGKNTRMLGGKPLLVWSIEAAKASGLFQYVVVSTDSRHTMYIADEHGCLIHDREPAHATDEALDYLWVNDVMQELGDDIFCILRPTSPFRTASTIRRAYAAFIASGAHSLRAVEKAQQHPGKMWTIDSGFRMSPLLHKAHPDGTPWHSSPTQSLDPVYVQNASLEMAWTWVLKETKTISGVTVCPFFTDHFEGYDINTEEDFAEAERIAAGLTAVESPSGSPSAFRYSSP